MKDKINYELFSKADGNENMPQCSALSEKNRRPKFYFLLPYLLSFIVPVGILMAVMAMLQVFPTAEKSILALDLTAQYTDFFAYYQSIFTGENSLWYCLSQTLGNTMWGILPYYLLSPFNFILLFFPAAQLPAAVYVITMIKIGACGVACYVFLKKVFHSSYVPLIFSTCYALMSFNMVYLSHIMWIDGVLLLPVIALGIHRILDKKRPLCYILSLFLALVTNYYIGYMLCIFTVIYFLYGVLRTLPKESKIKYIWKKAKTYLLSSVIAGGMAAVILLPAFFALSGGKATDSTHTPMLANDSVIDILGNLYTAVFRFSDLRAGAPNIFAGIFILVLSVLFFVLKGISVKTKLLSAGLVAVFVLSFDFTQLDLIWHGFSPPNWFTHRYAFIFSFILIILAMESFQHLKSAKPGLCRYSITCGCVLAATVLLAYLNSRLSSKLFLLDLLLILFFFILLYFVHMSRKKAVSTLATLSIAVVSSANMAVNGYAVERSIGFNTSNQSFVDFYDQYSPVVEKAKNLDSGFYRIEKDYMHTFNDAMFFSYSGITHYSSNLKMSIVSFFDKMGYKTNEEGVFISNAEGNTIAFDSIFNIKYFLSQGEYHSQYEHILQENGVNFYKNPYALGLGFTVPDSIGELGTGKSNAFQWQNEVLRQFVPEIQEDVFQPESLLDTKTENIKISENNGNIILEKIDAAQPARVIYTYEKGNAADPVYICLENSERAANIDIQLNGESVPYSDYYHGMYYNYIHPINVPDAAQTYTISIELLADTFVLGTPCVYSQSMEVFQKYYEQLSDGSYHAEKNSSASFSGQVTAGENERLFFSLPYDKGWTVYIDGQKAETESIFNTFLSVKIPAGTHTVELSFIPPGLIAGGIISGISAGALAGYLVLLYRKDKNSGERRERNGKRKS